MDGPTARMLFEALREDIRSLKRDVADVLARHEQDLEEMKEFKWRMAGAYGLAIMLFEVGIKFVEHAIK